MTSPAQGIATDAGLLELMFHSTHLCIAMLDPELRFVRVNQAYADTCKRGVDFFPGKGHFELFPHEENEAIFRRVASTLEPISVLAKPFEHPDTPERGTTWWDWTLTPILEAGELKGLLFILVDVTERVNSELELGRSEERFRVVVEHVGAGVALVSPDGRVLESNALLGEWFPHEGSHGLPCRPAGQPSSGRCRCERCPVNEVLAGASARTQSFTADTPEGARWFEVRASPVHDHRGVLTHAVVVFEDLTQRMEVDHLRSRNERVEALGLLGGGIAHDFNNLLSAVMGNLSFALGADVGDDDRREALRDAMSAAEVARGVAAQLLSFAKGGEPRRSNVDVASLLRETVSFSVHGSAVQVLWALEPDLGTIHADYGQLAQVIANLVLNARHAMKDRGELRIGGQLVASGKRAHVELEPVPHVHIVVSDSGPGISPENLRRVFDPYFSTKRGAGSGIGLATAAQIARRHGGLLTASSAVGTGASFELWLPVGEPCPESESRVPLAPNVRSRRVLVVEDEPVLRRLFERFITYLGHEVIVVEDGVTGLAQIESARASGEPFDVAILDLTIPGGVGGIEVVERLAGDVDSLRFVATSGYSEAPVLQHPADFGFHAVLTKPFTLEDLRAAFASL